jgi:hypothetical protein
VSVAVFDLEAGCCEEALVEVGHHPDEKHQDEQEVDCCAVVVLKLERKSNRLFRLLFLVGVMRRIFGSFELGK